MKYQSILLAAMCCSSTLASAIELTDYTEPNSAFDEAYINFNANASSGNQDQSSYNALLNGFYNKRDSNRQRVLGLRIDGNFDASRGPNSGDESVDDFGFSIGGNRDAYFSEQNDKLFYFLSGEYAHQDRAIDDNIGFTAGIGYGRVWNATPLAKALRVQHALGSHGLLNGEIKDGTLRELAEVIAKEDEYRAREGADTYRATWYAEMERIMLAAGALKGDALSALATVKLDEVLFDEPISARRHGWLVRAGAGFQISDFSGIIENDSKLTFQFEYAKPYGLRGQLIELATYEPIFGDNTVQLFSNRLSFSYEISDRIDWVNTWDLTVQKADDDAGSGFTTNALTSTFLYHLTNQLDLGLTLAVVDTVDKPNLIMSNDEVSTSANFSLRYRVK